MPQQRSSSAEVGLKAEVVARRFEVSIPSLGLSFACPSGEDVLRAMMARGRRGIGVGCRGGGCGVCRVQVLQGDYATKPMSRTRISESDEQVGLVLACRIFPTSDVVLEPRPSRRQVAPQEIAA